LIRPSDSILEPPVTSSSGLGHDESRVRIELLDIAARSGAFAGSLTIAATAFVYLLLGDFTGLLPAAWTVSMIVVSVGRIVCCMTWHRMRTAERALAETPGAVLRIDPVRLLRWERIHVGIALICGLAWASLVFLLVSGSERTTILVGSTLTIALVFASSFYASNRVALALFALPIIVAQVFNLLRIPAEFRDVLAFAWLGLIAVLYFMPRISSVLVRDGLVARIVHERRASEQTALLDTAPLGILVVRELRIVACNEALLKLLGYTRREDVVGQSARILFPDDDAWKQAVKICLMAHEGRVPPQIVRRRRSDGSSVDVMHNVAVIRGPGGEISYIGIYEDVQDRMAIEEGYRHAMRMQRLVFESAGEGIAIVSNGIIEQANQALSDLVGVPASQLTGRSLQSIFEDPQGWAEIEKRFQRLGNTLKLERRIVRSDGRAIWTNVTGCLVDSPAEEVDGHRMPVAAGALKRSVWILADLTVQKQKEAENWHHANHDVMTGLPNRRFLQDRLDQALAFARRDGRRVAIVELDLDGFKSVNDNYGHRFGDAVLEEVARRLSMVVRELDTVGRWGGDEFVLVLKEIESAEVVEETVKRVIARLTEPIVYLGQNLSIGASIGIALFPDHGEEVETLMLAADLAMYESKASGGNTWRFSAPTAEAPRGKYRASAAQPTTFGG
jgi:diguanylate cyclase (GGDEF)-like protein/PAS domain S-box-containing protein